MEGIIFSYTLIYCGILFLSYHVIIDDEIFLM